MKNAIILICLFGASLASADVIKPGEKTDEAWSQESVDGHTFNYSVSDYGWRVVGAMGGASAPANSIKGLAIRYSMADSETEKRITPQTASRLTLDAVKKCSELGAMEEKEQSKQFPEDLKIQIQSSVVTSIIYDSIGNAGFSCSLTLTAKR